MILITLAQFENMLKQLDLKDMVIKNVNIKFSLSLKLHLD